MAKKIDKTVPDDGEEPAGSEMVRVTVVVTLAEGGTIYEPGDEFETTPARADALGDAVAM